MGLEQALWVFVAFVLGSYGALAILITVFQRRLIYKPDPRRITPDTQGLTGVSVETICTVDGAKLIAWYHPARPGQRTILYFHGNRGYIELRAERMADLAARGFGVLMMSYRGYGGSTGQPSEAANGSDAKVAYDWIRRQGVPAMAIVAFGESLGTGVATQLAASKVVAGLVLDSPYTSMVDLARCDYPWLPVRLLLRDHYETLRHIKRVTVPVLVIHGEADDLVPVAMGHAVHSAALSPARIVTYPGAGHLDHRAHGSFDVVAAWIATLTPTRKPSGSASRPSRILWNGSAKF